VARGQIHWKQAHDRAIAYYSSRNDVRALEREYRTEINQLPFIEIAPYLRLARLLLDQQRIGEVRDLLLKTFTFPQSPPEQAENGTLLATALFLSGDTTSAQERVRSVLAAKPDYLPAVQLLERINARAR
jgi:hypothetical protein